MVKVILVWFIVGLMHPSTSLLITLAIFKEYGAAKATAQKYNQNMSSEIANKLKNYENFVRCHVNWHYYQAIYGGSECKLGIFFKNKLLNNR